MVARIIRLTEITPHEEDAWRSLGRSAVEPNPLMEPDCLVPAVQQQSNGAECYLAVAEVGDTMYAAVPLRRTRQFHKFPYPFMTAQLRRTVESGTPLLDRQRGAEGMGAILRLVRTERRSLGARILVLPKLNEDGPALATTRTAAATVGLRAVPFESWEQPFLRRRAEPTYEQSYSKDFRAGLRRRRRRVSELLGEEPRLVDRADDPAAIDEYLALEQSSYKGTNGLALATQAGEPAYFREMCRRLTAVGRLHVLALEAGGQTLAMNIFVRGGDGLFGFKTTYDERYARFAPGIALHVAAMEFFHHSTDAVWIDTCCHQDNVALLGLFPDRKRITGLFVPLSSNPIDRLAIRIFGALRPMHRRVYDWRHRTPPSKGEGG